MATAVLTNNRFSPIYDRKRVAPMEQKRDLTEIIEKVRALQQFTKNTGVSTSRSIGLLIADLDPEETAELAKVINLNFNR